MRHLMANRLALFDKILEYREILGTRIVAFVSVSGRGQNELLFDVCAYRQAICV